MVPTLNGCLIMSQVVFPIAGVPSRGKMYRTSAVSDLHFAYQNKVYTVRFAKKIYTLILKPQKLYISSLMKVFFPLCFYGIMLCIKFITK
jgi:hypothetical protein